MGFTKDKKDRIKKYILEKINDGATDIVKKTADSFDISLNTVYRYIRELEIDNIIKRESGKLSFILHHNDFQLIRSNGDLQDESFIYDNLLEDKVKDLPKNIISIWQYAFTEMMNNAIDHSAAEIVSVSIFQSYIDTSVIIQDNGIGIFQKIKEFYHYDSLDDAVGELFKGKLTTDSENHSGEGIFFTSRILDGFLAISAGKIFTHNKYHDDLDDLKNNPELKALLGDKGTVIFMKLSNFSNKILKEVFDMFADVDGGFTKTHISIKNYFDDFPVSRSQARRLTHRFEDFEEIELDFDGVDEIGQGFAHELFVVFQNAHKNIKLVPSNTTNDVKRMIHHVTVN